MRSWLAKLLGVLATVAGTAALLFRAKGRRHQAEAALANEREAASTEAAELRRRIDAERRAVQQRHRHEQRQDAQTIERGERDHLESDW